jgi:hypothetical protein
MPWWGWVLTVWSVLAVAGGLALGARIGHADRRERAMRRGVWSGGPPRRTLTR